MTDQVDRAAFARAAGGDGPAEHAAAESAAARHKFVPPRLVRYPVFVLPAAPAMVCDRSAAVIQANQALADLAGVPGPDMLVGARLRGILQGSDDDAMLAWPGGGPRTRVRVVKVPLAPAPDGTELVMVLLVDVSDLRAAEQALAEERLRMAQVERVAGIGSWEYNARTGETTWSRGHYDLLGVKPGDVLPGAGAVLHAAHPDDREWLAGYWQEHRDSGEPIDVVYRVCWPSGEQRRLHALAEAQRDATGTLVRFTGSIRDITEQWRAEAALAEERVRLLEAQRIARMGSWAIEPGAGKAYLSPALAEMLAELGVDPQVSPLQAVHPDDRAALLELGTALRAEPRGATIEMEFRGAPPGRTVFLCRAQAERDAAGVLTRIFGTVQDITEARAMERQLREERRRFADAQRVASIGTWEWDPAADTLVWSDMLRDLYAVPRDEPVSYGTLLSIVHPDDRAAVDAKWRALAGDRRPMVCEYRVIRRDGEQRVFRAHGAAVTTPDGSPLLVGTAQDITEQHAAEARVRLSSQRFADLVSIAPVGIALFDSGERLVDANDALCELLGYPLEQLRGMTTEALTHPDDRPSHLPPVTKLLASGRSSYTVPQVVLLRADGEPVYCELNISMSVQDDGQQFWLVVFSDITERLRSAEVLRYQATHDDLTGLPNRFAVKEVLAELLAGPTRSRVAVLFCDIDNFKRVNDSLGHDAGDDLLVALARRLEAGMPAGCMAARLSGDEYVVICRDTEAVGGMNTLVATVGRLLRSSVPLRRQVVKVSATIGAAVPDAHSTPEDLLRFADAAMYQAKRSGPGQAAVASAALRDYADRQMALEGQLRAALAEDGLALDFQPVVDGDGVVLTAEALVRWPHPERGMLPPAMFLPVAEQGDLLRELDRWVLRTALREAARWPECRGRRVAVAVNLAGLVPGDPGFVDIVASAITESGIDWDRVVLELVETSLVDLPSQSRAAMGELARLGVRFAVDDFGTGYSSLARVKELPAQIVKVDRQFVASVGNNPSDFAVARAVVDMARAMGRVTVAEGVETPKQFHVLRGIGVDAYQGFLFSPPVPPRQLRAMLQQGPMPTPRSS